jgi:rare lipoprotein A
MIGLPRNGCGTPELHLYDVVPSSLATPLHVRAASKRNSKLKTPHLLCNRRVVRNVLIASVMAAMPATAVSIRLASAHAQHGMTKADGNHASHFLRIGKADTWRQGQRGRRVVREKLLASPGLSKAPVADAAESNGSFEDSGIASVYSGQRTASGEEMTSGAMTAAHRTLPFGTNVTVVNRHNGRSAVVRINDRGPFVRGRVIDLSPAAALALGVDGLASVSLTVGGAGGGESPQNGRLPDNGGEVPLPLAAPSLSTVTDPAAQAAQ